MQWLVITGARYKSRYLSPIKIKGIRQHYSLRSGLMIRRGQKLFPSLETLPSFLSLCTSSETCNLLVICKSMKRVDLLPKIFPYNGQGEETTEEKTDIKFATALHPTIPRSLTRSRNVLVTN